MLTDRLINELGLLKLQSKHCTHNSSEILADLEAVQEQPPKAPPVKQAADKLDKSEFRLLVKMLQAIGHECQYDNIAIGDGAVTYHHPIKTIIFNDINLPDSRQIMNLSALADLLANEQMKRPVWEKLKTLKS